MTIQRNTDTKHKSNEDLKAAYYCFHGGKKWLSNQHFVFRSWSQRTLCMPYNNLFITSICIFQGQRQEQHTYTLTKPDNRKAVDIQEEVISLLKHINFSQFRVIKALLTPKILKNYIIRLSLCSLVSLHGVLLLVTLRLFSGVVSSSPPSPPFFFLLNIWSTSWKKLWNKVTHTYINCCEVQKYACIKYLQIHLKKQSCNATVVWQTIRKTFFH